jgi:hypothetical protein
MIRPAQEGDRWQSRCRLTRRHRQPGLARGSRVPNWRGRWLCGRGWIDVRCLETAATQPELPVAFLAEPACPSRRLRHSSAGPRFSATQGRSAQQNDRSHRYGGSGASDSSRIRGLLADNAHSARRAYSVHGDTDTRRSVAATGAVGHTDGSCPETVMDRRPGSVPIGPAIPGRPHLHGSGCAAVLDGPCRGARSLTARPIDPVLTRTGPTRSTCSPPCRSDRGCTSSGLSRRRCGGAFATG